jgi:hypothetical protein
VASTVCTSSDGRRNESEDEELLRLLYHSLGRHRRWGSLEYDRRVISEVLKTIRQLGSTIRERGRTPSDRITILPVDKILAAEG